MAAHQLETRYFMDGCVAIYKRDDGSDVWQYRLRVPGIANRYLRRSSKTKDFAEAKKIANKEWNRLCFRQEEGLAVFTKTFGDVAQVVLAEQEDRVKRAIITDGHWSYRRTVIRRHSHRCIAASFALMRDQRVFVRREPIRLCWPIW